MPDTEPQYLDNISLEQRYDDLLLVFAEINEISGGVFNLQRLINAGRILDIGIGRGAVGKILREHGGHGVIVGVENMTNYEGKTAYDCYSRIDWKNIRNKDELTKLSGEEYDLIISIGISSQLAEFLIQNIGKFNLSPSGLMMLSLDEGDRVRDYVKFGFNHTAGSLWADGNIYWFENKKI